MIKTFACSNIICIQSRLRQTLTNLFSTYSFCTCGLKKPFFNQLNNENDKLKYTIIAYSSAIFKFSKYNQPFSMDMNIFEHEMEMGKMLKLKHI